MGHLGSLPILAAGAVLLVAPAAMAQSGPTDVPAGVEYHVPEALIGLRGTNPAFNPPETMAELRTHLSGVIGPALDAGLRGNDLDAFVNEAVSEGKIFVPKAVIGADGHVDTPMLVALMQGQPVPDAPAVTADASGGAQEADSSPGRESVPVPPSNGSADATETAAIAPQSAPVDEDLAPATTGEDGDAGGGPDASEPATPAEVYVVQRGDSLSAIAEQVYGDPFRFEEIYAANRGILSSPNRVYVGQRLTIPR